MTKAAFLGTLLLVVPAGGAAGELRGRILGARGAAVQGTVSAIPYETPHEAARREARKGDPRAALVSAATGVDGVFAIRVASDAPPFQLRLEGPGLVAVRLAGVYDGTEQADIGAVELPAAASVAGRVVDQKNRPVADAVVVLSPRVPFSLADDASAESIRTRTAADGSFRFDRAGAMGNAVRVEAKDRATAARSDVSAGVVPPIVLEAAAVLRGHVFKADGRTAAASSLVRFEGRAPTRWVEAEADGTFLLDDAAAGSGRLVADAGALGRAERAVTAPFPPAPITLSLAAPARLEGRVVEALSGRPVPRARIQVQSAGPPELVRSSPDGSYRFEGITPGHYRIAADEPRHVRYEREDIAVRAGAATKVDLALTLGASLSGRVVDERGAPVAGATGRLVLTDSGPRGRLRAALRRPGDAAFRTGPDGTFRAERLESGANRQLIVSHPEFAPRTLGGLLSAAGSAKTGLVVVLRRGLEIAGVVRDAEEQPVAGADVDVRPSASERTGRAGGFMVELGPFGELERPSATTGTDGRFRVAGLSAGAYAVGARKPGYADTRLDPVRVAPETGPSAVELVLAPGAAIRGFVKRPDGSGAKGFMVRARGDTVADRGPLGAGPLQPTGSDGAFAIEGLRAGDAYSLVAMGFAMGPFGGAPRVEGVVAPAEGIEIVVPGAGRIEGKVIDAETREPVTEFTAAYEPEMPSGGNVRFLRAPRSAATRFMRRDEDSGDIRSPDGTFALDEVPAGTWQLRVEAGGYEAGRVGGLVVRDGETLGDVEVRIRKGRRLQGRVVDASTGRAVLGASVSANEAGSDGPPLPPGFENNATLTDADGRFEITGLALGSYRVVARHADYAEASQVLELRQATAEAEIRLSTGGAVAGFVVSDAGAGVEGASVSIEAAGEAGFRFGPGPGGSSTVSDGSGRFRFDRLGAGRYSVSAALRGRSSSRVDLALQAGERREDVQVALVGGATLRGQVTGLEPALRASVNVFATGPEGYVSGVRPAADGAFTLGGVPVGSIDLRASAGDFEMGRRTASATVQVAEGQAEVEAEIAFEAGFTLSGLVTRGGEPVASAQVSAGARGPVAPVSFGRTDDAGSYRLNGLGEGAYTVSVFPPRGAQRSREVQMAGDTTLDFDLPLGRLAGAVVEAGSGLPLGEAEIESAGQGGGRRGATRASTDSTGRFALEGLEPGPWTLTIRRAGYAYETRTAEAAEAGGDDLRIELRRGEGMGVRARDAAYGVPLRGLFARVRDASGAVVFTSGVTLDSEGRGEIPSLRPGSYSIRLESSGYAPASLTATVPSPTVDVAFAIGGTLEIRPGPATLSRAPVAARLLTESGVPYSSPPFMEGSIMLSSGVRRVEHLPAGRYTLAVEGSATQAVVIVDGGIAVVELP